jgi:flagellar L-ring protein precursor FlgH
LASRRPRLFFKDLRATEVGDIVQVVIDINDKAEIDNATVRSRRNSEDAQTPALFGFEASLDQILPEAIDPTDLLELSSTSSSNGTGTIDREEVIEIKLTAVVSQVLPNGNLVIHGRQETRVNFEIRVLQIAGVIRPQDITNANTIAFEKIAEAHVAYGGRGHISDVQQPRYGQQIIDIIFPF